MMNPQDLITECAKVAYNGMTAAQKAAALVALSVTPAGTTVRVTREQIRATFDPAEFIALTPQKQNAVLSVLDSDQVYVQGSDATLLKTAFSASATTLASLVALRSSAITAAMTSIADGIGWGGISEAVLTDWIIKVGA